jgi:hypothetical protein
MYDASDATATEVIAQGRRPTASAHVRTEPVA